MLLTLARGRAPGLTPAGGGSAHQLVGSRIPEKFPPLAGAFAVFLFGSRHDGSDETMKMDVGLRRRRAMLPLRRLEAPALITALESIRGGESIRPIDDVGRMRGRQTGRMRGRQTGEETDRSPSLRFTSTV